MSEKQRFTTIKILTEDWRLIRALAAMLDQKQFEVVKTSLAAYAKANKIKVRK